MKTISLLCLGSRASAFTDHFFTICENLDALDLYSLNVLTSVKCLPSLRKQSLLVDAINYTKARPLTAFYGLIKWRRLIFSQHGSLFLYGEVPQHIPFAFLCRARLVSHVADPVTHPGVPLVMRIAFYFAKLIFILKSEYVYVSYEAGRLSLLRSFSLLFKFFINESKVRVVPFAQLNSVATALGEGLVSSLEDFDQDLVFFGRNEKYKGLDWAIRNLDEWCVSRDVSLALLVVSSGGLVLPRLQRLSVDILSQYLPDDQFVRVVSSSRFALFPYSHATGSHVVINSNSCGVPVIASSVGCFVDQVRDGINGFLFDALDSASFYDALDRAFLGGKARGALPDTSSLVEYAKASFSSEKEALELRLMLDSLSD